MGWLAIDIQLVRVCDEGLCASGWSVYGYDLEIMPHDFSSFMKQGLMFSHLKIWLKTSLHINSLSKA